SAWLPLFSVPCPRPFALFTTKLNWPAVPQSAWPKKAFFAPDGAAPAALPASTRAAVAANVNIRLGINRLRMTNLLEGCIRARSPPARSSQLVVLPADRGSPRRSHRQTRESAPPQTPHLTR